MNVVQLFRVDANLLASSFLNSGQDIARYTPVLTKL
jgi:hypothetical protein